MRAPFRRIGQALALQRGHLAEWVPICLALGVGAFFWLQFEPSTGHWSGLGALMVACLVALRAMHEDFKPLAAALVLVTLGAAVAGYRAHSVAGPVLGFRYYGPVEGRIVKIDRSASDAVRLTLDRVVLARTGPDRTPRRVRVSLHGRQGFIDPEPGLRVILTGNLSPPPGPVEPGGFDFQRQAWFQRLGAVGYTRTPVLVLEPAREGRAGLLLHRIRAAISTQVQAALPGDTGAFAAAVTTGDRSGMSQAVLEDLRRSNLAHLLAISGLHMGMLTGLIFAALRYGLALSPGLSARLPAKKAAALTALAAGGFYLALSGGNVATVRAFVMATVVLVAVMIDRRALTLRAVAVAAVIILVLTPEALLGPGFQMSFAATTALVAAFRLLQDGLHTRLPRWVRPVLMLVLSSAIAGAATAPFAAAHFNRFSNFGLLANVLSVPAMGLVVMPGAILAACLAPFGLAWLGLAVMARGIDWILAVAHWVAALPGAQTHIPAPPPLVLPLISLGLLWLILVQFRPAGRALGLAPVALALAMWSGAGRPDILVSETGGLIGVLTDEGRSLSKSRGEGFAALSWLENDGDGADQNAAFARDGISGKRGDTRTVLPGLTLAHVTGRDAAARALTACGEADIVVSSAKVADPQGACRMFDKAGLAQTGAISISLAAAGPRVVTVRQHRGERLWNSAAERVRRGY